MPEIKTTVHSGNQNRFKWINVRNGSVLCSSIIMIYCFFLSVEKSCDAYLVLKLYLSPENSTDMKELDIDNDRLNEILSNYDDCLVKFFKSYAWTMIISVVLILAGIYEMFGIYKESRKHIFVWMLAVGLVIYTHFLLYM